MSPLARSASGVALLAACLALVSAPRPASGQHAPAPDLLAMAASSELRDAVERFVTDRNALNRRYDAPFSAETRGRLGAFYEEWWDRLQSADFERLSPEGRIDHVLMRHQVRYERSLLQREEAQLKEMEELLPFAPAIVKLQESRRRREAVDPRAAAEALVAAARAVDEARAALASGRRGPRVTPAVAVRAADAAESLRGTLDRWYRYFAGYDPLFSWWVEEPQKRLNASLFAYAKLLRERLAGYREGADPPIVGDPIGEAGLKADLEHEMIPYTPKELIALAERELAWCHAELRKAAREMGYGDDWHAALEKVKTLHVEPGQQSELVRELADEAVRFVEERDLVTVPPLAKEVWRMEMLSPEAQKVSPFFLGGEVVRVSYPTHTMAHEDKLMSMRGNNRHFSRATVQHELIPGHHLQQFMNARYNTHRQAFYTPFWVEGWALYWEMLLWDLGFPKSPEDKIGMLFWRSHRAARIIFSLKFHLGQMSPQEAIDFLVERVGHERANATAEVRRSFAGAYSPLYQAAYMLGGLQFRALHGELVGSGRMSNREFHDTILKGGHMPVELVRARLARLPLTKGHEASWRFAGDLRRN
ncbi:MAG: DUF885 family protein [Armatimonadota bacterium]